MPKRRIGRDWRGLVLITRNESWEESRIRVLASNMGISPDEAVNDLKNTLQEVRIEAEPEIIEETGPDIIARLSADADLCFIPFRFRKNELICPFDCSLDLLIQDLPMTAFVLAAEDVDLDAEPEEGRAGAVADALDALNEAEKRAEQAEVEASKAAEEAENRLAELQGTTKTGADEEILDKIKSAREAKEEAIRMARKAAKAAAKAEEAARVAEALGVMTNKEESTD